MPIWIIDLILGLLVLVLLFLLRKRTALCRFYELLAQLNEAVADGQNQSGFAQRMMAAMCQATQSSAGLLYIQDQSGLRLKASHGLDSEKLGEAAIDLGMRRLLLNRAASEGIFAQDCTEQGFLTNFSAVLGMPLFHETTLGGVVVLFRVSGRYSPGLLELMNRFSHRAAAALKNVLIEQENEAAVEENARLYLDLSKLYRRATVDNLTGMYNRAHMTQRLNEEIKKSWRFKQPLTLVAVNLDNFRQINQQYGTKTGDEVLRIISRVMRKTARDYDIICRHGGDDFAIILPQTSTEGAVALAERLRREVAITIFPSAIHIALSMGVAGFTATTSDRTQINEECVNQAVKSLCELTEEALELAKNAGGDRVETLGEFDPAKIAGLE